MKIRQIIRQVLLNGDSREKQASWFGNRPVSYPFISGDTFAASSDFVVSATAQPLNFDAMKHPQKGQTVFLETDFAAKSIHFDYFLNWLEYGMTKESLKPKIIIHNGDENIPQERLDSLLERCSDIYGVNIINESEQVHALPIGLENVHYRNNGALSDFISSKNDSSMNNSKVRSGVIGAFNVSTNISERAPLAELMASSRHKFYKSRIPSAQLRQLVANAKFVVSPPGNGYDCHRTWEAIYLGAIPVVLEGCLAKSLVDNLPILSVKSWEQFLQTSDSELDEIFENLMTRDTRKGYMDYWINEFSSTKNI